MTADWWNSTFDSWVNGPGVTEQQKCDNAERMIRDAVSAHTGLKKHDIKVFVQGSYRNRTNVRMDSDVDVCVLCKDTFIPDYSLAPGINSTTLGFTDAGYHFSDLKRDVEEALVNKFGRASVTRGDKAFDIKENTFRVAADVVPTFEGRLYFKNSQGEIRYHSGTVLQCSSDGKLIKNWPEQHYENGVEKHTQTNRQFKKKVRCLKRLCNVMASEGVSSAKAMASFLLESLVYNCPNDAFAYSTHYEDMKAVIAYLLGVTENDSKAKNLVEVNGIKYLFHFSQPWDRTTAHAFLISAWNYVGFGK